MHWLKTEYILKGVYLGLLLDIALFQAQEPTVNWQPLTQLGICTGIGVLVALIISAIDKMRKGYRVQGRPGAFTIFLLLESPILIYAGVIIGTLCGMYLIRGPEPDKFFAPFVLGGAILGAAFGALQAVEKNLTRIVTVLLVLGGVMAALSLWFGLFGKIPEEFRLAIAEPQRTVLSGFLLLGIPFFYLLTFAGIEEESEVEMASMCALLGIALVPFTQDTQFKSVPFLVPVGLYFWYSMRVLPHFRVFKHTLRGISHARCKRYRLALLAFRRALQLNPNNELAKREFWRVHTSLDLNLLANDPLLIELVDFDLCVHRAGTLLMAKPTPEKMEESHRLLDLVLSQRPKMRPRAMYWWAVGHCHNRKFDEAVNLLNDLLSTDKHDPADPHRRAVLMQAWQLSLMTLDILRQQVGDPQLEQPGRRMEAITVVEEHLEKDPGDEEIWPLKKLLYQELTLDQFEAASPEGTLLTTFDYNYARKLGMNRIEDAERWQHGLEFLKIAVRGLRDESPSILRQIAEVYQREGNEDEAWKTYHEAYEIGKKIGHQNLSEEERQTFFHIVRLLGERALAQEKYQDALKYYQLIGEWNRSGVDTLRTIATIHEKLEDPIAALRVTDRALVYDSKDKDLLERKDRYYYSVMPEQVEANRETLATELDIDYCLEKARTLLDHPGGDYELLDWAEHLLSIAAIVRPKSIQLKVLIARIHWRRGDMEEARKFLEEVRPKPEKFSSQDEEEAWYQCCQLLGDLYLNNFNRADLAIDCLQDFRKSSKSGAKTLFRIGQAYEQLGDTAKAIKWYTQVTAYEGNPLSYDAQEAIDRLSSPAE